MKKTLFTLFTILCISTFADDFFTPKQIENAKQIQELHKTNKGGKNKKEILKLMKEQKEIENKKHSNKNKQLKK